MNRRLHDRVALLPALLVLLALGSGSTIVSAQSSPSDSSTMVALDQRAPVSTNEPAAEQQLLALLNSTRAEHGLGPLRMDGGLQSVARAHSFEMATNGYVGHGSLSGASALERLSRAARGLVGENVSFGVDCEAVHRALVASNGHRDNILNPAFNRVGIGVFSAGTFGLAVTQDFAE